jgi:hypothetical protein
MGERFAFLAAATANLSFFIAALSVLTFFFKILIFLVLLDMAGTPRLV